MASTSTAGDSDFETAFNEGPAERAAAASDKEILSLYNNPDLADRQKLFSSEEPYKTMAARYNALIAAQDKK